MRLSICDTSWLEPKHVPPCRPAPPPQIQWRDATGQLPASFNTHTDGPTLDTASAIERVMDDYGACGAPLPVLCQGCDGKGVSCARCKGTGLVFPPNRQIRESDALTNFFDDVGQGTARIIEGDWLEDNRTFYAFRAGFLTLLGIAAHLSGIWLLSFAAYVVIAAFVYLQDRPKTLGGKRKRPSITNNPGTG